MTSSVNDAGAIWKLSSWKTTSYLSSTVNTMTDELMTQGTMELSCIILELIFVIVFTYCDIHC